MIKEMTFDAEYASEVMDEIPAGYINKTICGCGLTTVALENNVDTVIAVPTIYLAQNKASQYPNERYPGNVLAVTGETNFSDIEWYRWNNRRLKIITTYDSLPKVEHLLSRCKLVIDESNELLSKTKLKPNVIDQVFEIAKRYKDTVSFVSATPTPLEYMPKWISEIDQVTIKWTKTMKAKPILYERRYPYKALIRDFLVPLKENGKLTVSGKTFKKVIVFINSVDHISKVIKESKLDNNECGIICGDSLKNDIKTRGIRRYLSGDLPEYLFITSSGFAGIDLYDKDAMTIVVSSTNRTYQMIDMLTDLKQAVSRQRDKDNPNYGSFIYIYNQSIFNRTEAELIQKIDAIYDSMVSAIRLYEYGVENKLENGFFKSHEFNLYTLFKNGTYEINEQAFMADKYFILEIRNQYTKGFDMSGQFEGSEVVKEIKLPKEVAYKDLVDYFKSSNIDGEINWGIYAGNKEWIRIIEKSHKLYGKVWKDQSYAKMMIENFGDGFAITRQSARKFFATGKRYSRNEIKAILQRIYNEQNIKRKAKHTDLDDIFKEVKHTKSKGVFYARVIEK